MRNRGGRGRVFLAGVLAVVVAVMSPAAAFASGEKLSLGLEDAVSYALAHSPQVRMAEYRRDSARYASWEAERVKTLVGELVLPDGGQAIAVALSEYQLALLTELYPFQAAVASDVASRAWTATRETPPR